MQNKSKILSKMEQILKKTDFTQLIIHWEVPKFRKREHVSQMTVSEDFVEKECDFEEMGRI